MCVGADYKPIVKEHTMVEPDKKLGEDILSEALLLSRCDICIHPTSNISTAAAYINPNLRMINLENTGLPGLNLSYTIHIITSRGILSEAGYRNLLRVWQAILTKGRVYGHILKSWIKLLNSKTALFFGETRR